MPSPETGLHTVDKLESSHWRSLSQQMDPGLRLFSQGWYEAWSAHLVNSGKWTGPVQYCTVSDHSSNIVAILPLAYQKFTGFKALSLAGPYMPFRCVPTTADASCHQNIYQRLADFYTRETSAPLIRFGPTPANSPEAKHLPKALSDRGWIVRTKEKLTEYWQQLPESYEAYKAAMSGRRLKRIRQYQRQLEKLGKVDIHKYKGLSTSEWQSLMPKLEHIELNAWVGRNGGDDRFIQPENQRFWASFLGAHNPDCQPTIWILYLDDEPISYDFVVDCGETRYALHNAYHMDFSKFSTGSILLNLEMEDAFTQHIKKINWGPGDSGYKTKWGAQPAQELIDFVAFRRNASGLLISGMFDTQRKLKKLVT